MHAARLRRRRRFPVGGLTPFGRFVFFVLALVLVGALLLLYDRFVLP
jgi:hypothetical protein